jgi:UDP:flavonoid glycosyltransferase YjiC (YdhE family)
MAVESFADTDYQVIMTTGGRAALPDLAENFFVTDYAPGSKIMAKSDVVICHGGNGTIYQGMAQGVPIIGIPQFHDQEYNLNRVTDLGLGRGLNGSNIQPRDIKDAVDAVLSQKSYREKAAAFKRLVSRYNGPATGAGLIDRF